MNTRLLMMASALFLALLGLPCVFAADVVLRHFGGATSPPVELLVQATGALYFGFAGLNWMGRANLIGGIYGRPVAIGNLLHFLVAGMALAKFCLQREAPPMMWVVAALYAIFALSFAFIVFGNPLRSASAPSP